MYDVFIGLQYTQNSSHKGFFIRKTEPLSSLMTPCAQGPVKVLYRKNSGQWAVGSGQ